MLESFSPEQEGVLLNVEGSTLGSPSKLEIDGITYVIYYEPPHRTVRIATYEGFDPVGACVEGLPGLHCGVMVLEKYRGRGIAELMYKIKTRIEGNIAFEHVTKISLMTFYLKQGYVPCGVVVGQYCKPEDAAAAFDNWQELADDNVRNVKKALFRFSQRKQDGNLPFTLKMKYAPEEVGPWLDIIKGR